MADKDGLKVAKDYHTDVPFGNQGSFHVKGANNTDWGMKRHLSNIFDPVSGNTVMFAFDHGYFMGSTAGLERLDITIPAAAQRGRADGHPRCAAHLRAARVQEGHCAARVLWLFHDQRRPLARSGGCGH